MKSHGTITATSAMTLFSYLASFYKNENFKEPELLGDFISSTGGLAASSGRPLGWASHYLIGLGWTVCYKRMLRVLGQDPSMRNGLAFGAASGVIGVLAWQKLFDIHPNPPQIRHSQFNKQLVIAHMVFGATLYLCNKNTNRARR